MQVKNNRLFQLLKKYIFFILLLINLLAVIFLLLSVLSWFIRPSHAPLIANFGLPFPIFLVINILFLIAWLFLKRWKSFGVQFVILLLFLSPILTYFPLHFKKHPIPSAAIKILSYNVRGFNSLTGKSARSNPIFSYVLNQKPDIICFQEFCGSVYKSPKSLISLHELDSVFHDYPYHVFTPLEGSKYAELGIACYSKFPILDSQQLPLVSTFNGSALYHINIHGKTVSFINNHLESNKITVADKELYHKFFTAHDSVKLGQVLNNMNTRLTVAHKIRENQVNVIKNFILKRSTRDVILCGDFNDAPISYAYHTIRSTGLTDAFANTGLGQGLTYYENHFLFRIDYIFHSKSIQSYDFEVGKVHYSDHYPVMCYLSINQ